MVRTCGTIRKHSRRMFKKARLLTRPTPAVTSPASPESAKTASSPRGTPCPRQGRSFSADPRFTFYASRFTAPGSDARTKVADFYSILLELVERLIPEDSERFSCV